MVLLLSSIVRMRARLEQSLPTREQWQKGFEALDTDKERAIYLFLGTTGLRRSEALNLTKDDVDFEMRCVKAKHDTRTKRAGVTFYNEECEHYLRKYLASRNDDKPRLFRIGYREFVGESGGKPAKLQTAELDHRQ